MDLLHKKIIKFCTLLLYTLCEKKHNILFNLYLSACPFMEIEAAECLLYACHFVRILSKCYLKLLMCSLLKQLQVPIPYGPLAASHFYTIHCLVIVSFEFRTGEFYSKVVTRVLSLNF